MLPEAEAIDHSMLVQIGIAVASFIAVSGAVYGAVAMARRRKIQTKIVAIEQQSSKALERVASAELQITKEQSKVREMGKQLADARQLVEKSMAQEGSILGRYQIPYADLKMYDSIGEGAFGTVFKAVLRGELAVAVKTMRVSKITEEQMDKASVRA